MLFAAACGIGAGPKLEQPVGETHTTSSSTGGARPQGVDAPEATIGVVVGEDVMRLCNMRNPPRDVPRFDFEAARLVPRGDDVLARVAACVASGRLGSDTLTLTGHTDPRGTTEYNKQLGTYRALAAKQHLVDLGVAPSFVLTDSRGERDAQGSNEPSWASDRKVEVHLTGR